MDLPFSQPIHNLLQDIIYSHKDITEALSVNQDNAAISTWHVCPNRAYGMVFRGDAMVCPFCFLGQTVDELTKVLVIHDIKRPRKVILGSFRNHMAPQICICFNHRRVKLN